jgi:hypothetical protein
MTSTEALAELRVLLVQELTRPARDRALVKAVLWDIHWILEGGVTPLIELRLRRYRRRAGFVVRGE